MNSLLARQIRKLLDDELKKDSRLTPFLTAIEKSYQNYEDQFSMLQRAMSISSEELFEVNLKLKKETKQQQKVIARLEKATKVLERISIQSKTNKKNTALNGIELAELIEKQAKQISKIEKQRKKIFNDLEKSNQELSEYAHVVSHDLKSPLRTIDTLIHWIKEDTPKDLPENIVENLNLIDKNIEKMDSLINDILEYSLIDKKPSDTTLVDTYQLCNEIVSLTSVPQHIKITVNPLPVINIDKVRLKQVFQNLLSNSIASIDKIEGLIEVTARDIKTHWEFSVTDNGKGIATQYHSKIFEVFQSLESKGKSTGIGLSIVKKIVALFDGEVWIDSSVGVGTTFFFTLKKH